MEAMERSSLCRSSASMNGRRVRLRSGVSGVILCLLGTILIDKGVSVAAEPAEKRLAPIVVAEANLPMTPPQYKELWMDTAFYERYLRATGDVDIKVGAWKPASATGPDVGPNLPNLGKRVWAMERVVSSCHPVKVRVPGLGLPKCAVSTKRQWLAEYSSGSSRVVLLKELNEVQGVPFSDRFYIESTWMARWDGSSKALQLSVVQQVVVKQPFMLERLMEKNSEKETKETLAVWLGLVVARVGAGGALDHAQQATEGRLAKHPLLRLVWSGASSARTTSGVLLLTGLITSYLLIVPRKKGGSSLAHE